MLPTPAKPNEPTALRHGWLLIVLLWAALAAVRLTGPSDLMDDDQQKPASYSMDILNNGRWIMQTDSAGGVATKPPLHAWLLALSLLASAGPSMAALQAPSALAMLGAALIACALARRRFGPWAGLFAGFALLLSPLGTRLLGQVRTDALYTCLTIATIALAVRAWERGGAGAWTLAWLAAAGATLTKGPLAVLLVAFGMVGALWERRRPGTDLASPPAAPLRVRAILPGLALYLLVAGGWLALAYAELGRRLIDTLIGRELLTQAVTAGSGNFGTRLLHPTAYFFSFFAPWSVLAAVGVWRAIARPAVDGPARRLERFLVCHLLLGLVVFSLAAHKRPEHLAPLFPAAAILAGREVALILAALRDRTKLAAFATAGALSTGAALWYYHVARRENGPIVLTGAVRDLAHRLRAEGVNTDHVAFVDTPYTLQFHMGLMRHTITPEAAAELLATDPHAIVATRDPDAVRAALPRDAPKIQTIDQAPIGGAPAVTVLARAAH